MDQERYRRDHSDRLSLYMDAGYQPNETLLLSYDDKHGTIDTGTVERMIRAFVLP